MLTPPPKILIIDAYNNAIHKYVSNTISTRTDASNSTFIFDPRKTDSD